MTTGSPPPDRFPPRTGSGPGAGRPPRRHSRARTVVALSVAAWTVLEIWLLTLVGDQVGALGVLALLLAGVVLGTLAIRYAGRRAWRRLAESLQPGAAPDARPGADRDGRGGGGNALVMLGGLLLMLPGLLSDVCGLLCLFPPTAALLRRAGERYLSRRTGYVPGTFGDAMRQARSAGDQVRIHRPDGKIVPGEVVPEEPERRTGESGEEPPLR